MPADFKTGGVKAVHHSPDGAVASWTKVNGEVNEANNLPTEAIAQETTNSEYQSGESATPEIIYSDHQDYETMRDKAVGANRTKLFFCIEYYDGRLVKTTEAVYPKVVDQPVGSRSDGDSQWMLGWTLHATKSYEDIASLT